MSKRRVLLATVGVVVLVAVISLLLAKPKPGPEHLYGHLIPRWQVFRAEELRHAGSPAAEAMLRAAQPWPALLEPLRGLDQSYPDEVLSAVARINQAARAAGVPYWLEVQTIKGRPVVLSHKVEHIHHWRAGERRIEVLYLRRQDHLNIEMGLIGQASSNGPLVFLDRIEDEWVEDLGQLFGKKADAAVNQTGRKLMMEKARAQLGDVVIALAHDLAEVRMANQALKQPQYAPAMASLVALLARGVEAHEARHALDTPSPPLPAFLRTWANQDFATQINHELRAYLGELHDAPQAACFSVVSLVRVSFSPKARFTPHFFAGRIIAYGLDGKVLPEVQPGQGADDSLRAVLDNKMSGLDPVAFMGKECRATDSDRRDRITKLWRQLYGEAMPDLERDDGQPASLAAGPE